MCSFSHMRNQTKIHYKELYCAWLCLWHIFSAIFTPSQESLNDSIIILELPISEQNKDTSIKKQIEYISSLHVLTFSEPKSSSVLKPNTKCSSTRPRNNSTRATIPQSYFNSITGTLSIPVTYQLHVYQWKHYNSQGVSCFFLQKLSHFTCDQGSVVVYRTLDRWYKSENQHHHNLRIETPRFHLHQVLQLPSPFLCKTCMPLQNINGNWNHVCNVYIITLLHDFQNAYEIRNKNE